MEGEAPSRVDRAGEAAGQTGRGSPGDPVENAEARAGKTAGQVKTEPSSSAAPEEASWEGDGKKVIMSMALLLVRHAMQDTFGSDAVKVSESEGEVEISTDGARARLRIVVAPPSRCSGEAGPGEEGQARGAPAWSCEVVGCEKEPLRNQLTLLVERLRAAVSKS